MDNKFLTYLTCKASYIACCLTFFCVFINYANAQNFNSEQRLKKIVIDAGHGGKDPGTSGKKTKEKTVTLSVALKLGELINQKYPEVEVIYTRKTDVAVGLQERGNIANRNNADLFISIHVDGYINSAARGASTWVMGLHKSAANLEVSKRENAVIALEEDYSSKYQNFDPKSTESYIMFSLLQNAHQGESLKFAELVQNEMITNGPIKTNRSVQQAGFLVLWNTAMPSILIEMGFLTNPTEEAILADDGNQLLIAKSIFSAFEKYKQQYEKTSGKSTTSKVEKPKQIEIDITNNNTTSNSTKTNNNVISPTIEQNKENPTTQIEKPTEIKNDIVNNNTKIDSIVTPPTIENVTKENIASAIENLLNAAEDVKENPTIKENTNTTIEKPATEVKEKTDTTKEIPAPAEVQKSYYAVQVMAIFKKIPTTSREFKGHKNVTCVKVGNYYKYVIGNTSDFNEARKLRQSLQKDFPGSFVVLVEKDNVTPKYR